MEGTQMNRVNDLIEKIELIKAAYFSGIDFESRYNYIIGGIEANDIRIMYDEGKQNIDELVSALEELATLKPELDSYRISILQSAKEIFINKYGVLADTKNERKVLLTGEPISDEMKEILYKLEKGIDVPLEKIEGTKEMKLARTCVNKSLDTIYLVGREGMRANIVNKLMKRGSVSGVDEKGKPVYNGIVENNSRLDIVIGLPASGKSSAIVNSISTEYKSRLIDNDEAKKEIPEYNDGWGSGLVHSESQLIEMDMLKSALEKGDNIVYPKVGSDYIKMMKVVNAALDCGYSVNVHYVELNRNKALGRMINRFIDEGRFLDPKLIDKYDNPVIGNKIAKTYDELKGNKAVKGYSKWDNDVKKGEKPKLIETNCKGRLFGTENMNFANSDTMKAEKKVKKPKSR